METPYDFDSVLQRILRDSRPSGSDEVCALAPEDQAYLSALVASVRAGKRAVVIVEDDDDRLRYMFSNVTRAEAISVLGKVIESTGRRLAEGDD